ncbi:MAG TPA: FAD-dependent oxidoreductase [Candidatus Paceibacterota bacterium]
MVRENKKIIIIGGGLAGLALATELVDEGLNVMVLEKHQRLGGRASNTFDRKMDEPVPIGPHVFVTAYNNFRRFLGNIESEHSISWERKIFIEIVYHKQHHQFRISHIPRPFYMLPWILRYPFISWRDKLSHIRLAIKISFTSDRKLERLDDINTCEFLTQLGVTENSINKFWRFFVLSLLNVPIEICSAAEFALLMKHWSRLKNRKFGFAKVGLGDVFVKAAKQYIESKGGSVRHNTSVTKISFNEDGQIDHLLVHNGDNAEKLEADVYVSTLNPVDLRGLLPNDLRFSDFFANLNAFEPVSYISTNLWFDKKVSRKKFWALLNDSLTPQCINTDFYDQSNIYASREGNSYITSNIIFSKQYENMSDAQIIEKTIEEIKGTFPHFDGKLIHSHVHRIPYVVYAPLPGMRKHKLPHSTPIANLYLAGDWTSKELTQCMESAVRSGYRCAETILESYGIYKKIGDYAIR